MDPLKPALAPSGIKEPQVTDEVMIGDDAIWWDKLDDED